MHVFLLVCSKSSGPLKALDGRGAGKACRMFLDVSDVSGKLSS
jgi:hypothetical protein